jgi:predicted nucleic acid-binding protein
MELANDQDHARAITHWERISPANQPLLTTTFVFSEVVTYLNSRRFHSRACEVGDRLLHSEQVQLFVVDDDLFEQGWLLLKQQQDKTYSLTDCISFVLMRRMQITTAFEFDHHFRQAGFLTEPD